MTSESFNGDEVAALVRAASGDWSGATLEEHVREAFRVMKRVIPHDALAAYVVPTNSAAVPLFSESIDESSMLEYPRHYRQFDPMARAFGDPDAPVQTLVSSASKQGISLGRSVFLNEFLIPRLGIQKILGINIFVARDTALAVSLHRRKGLPEFTDREILAVRLALMGLSRAFSLTFSHERSVQFLRKAPAAARPETSGVAIYGEDLQLLHATASARDILLRLEEDGGVESLLEVGARLVKKLESDPTLSFADTAMIRPLTRGVVNIRLIATKLDPGPTLQLQILLDLVPSAVDVMLQRVAAPYGLTPRELDVLGLLHDGLTQVAIGKKLKIAATSVREHLVNVRRKVGAATNEQVLPRMLGLS